MKITQYFNKDFANKIAADQIFEMAASLSYYTALSLSPLLILIVTSVSFMGDTFKSELVSEIQGLVGNQAAEAIRMIMESAQHGIEIRGLSSLFGLLTLLLSAGGIFQELRISLNRIFEAKAPEEPTDSNGNVILRTTWGFLKEKIFNMGMVLTFVFILIISLVVSSVISLWLTGTALILGQTVNFLVSTAIFTALFGGIYYFLPQRRISRRLAVISGFITALLFSFGKTLIGAYLGQSAVASAYGAAGSMIVLLMWVYYSSIIIFLSAEISHRIEVVNPNA